MWTDDAGNLIGYIGADDAESRDHRHRSSSIAGGAATRVVAHMDELSMLVKRVEPDGTLHMTQLGIMYPGNFGLGPVAVLGDHQTLTAVLTLGSEHTTQESRGSGRPNRIRVTACWTGNTSTSSPGALPTTCRRRGARRDAGLRGPQQARPRGVRTLCRRLLSRRQGRGDRVTARRWGPSCLTRRTRKPAG